MASNDSDRPHPVLGAGLSLLLLAQAAGAPSYNLGIPVLPGTYTPESNPATVVTPPPPNAAPPAPPAPGSIPAGTAATAPPGPTSGPGYSFGAAPPPIGASGPAR